jgi:hypothetical protein
MFGQPKKNPNRLRVIKTARTAKAINAAADAGVTPLIKAVEPGGDIQRWVAVYQHPKTKKIKLWGDCRWEPGDGYELVLPFRSYYPYSFPEPFAAYLLPADLKQGERVWIEDVIEDIVAVWGNQGYNPRLECAEASWNGHDFTIHFDPEKDAPRLVG